MGKACADISNLKLKDMKNILALVFMTVCALTVHGQNIKIDSISGKYKSQGIEILDSLKKDVLYNKSIEWITLNYKSAKDVIQLSDKESYKIIVKGNFNTSLFMKEGWIGHTLILEFKDGKMRYIYTDFNYYSPGTGGLDFESKSLGFKKKLIQETDQNIQNAIQSLKKYILQVPSKSTDW